MALPQLSLVPRRERLGTRLATTIRYYEKRSLEMGVAIRILGPRNYFCEMFQHYQSVKVLSLENLALYGAYWYNQHIPVVDPGGGVYIPHQQKQYMNATTPM